MAASVFLVYEQMLMWLGGRPISGSTLSVLIPPQELTPLSGGAFALDEIQQLIDGLVEQVALIDCAGTIIAVNKKWKLEVARQARHGLHITRDYDDFLSGLVANGDDGVVPILNAFREIAAGLRQRFHCIYRGSAAFAGYDLSVTFATLQVHDVRHILVSVHDVTELVALKRQRRRAGGELLRAQEGERRRIARDLHDSTSQDLVALQLALSRLEREHAGDRVDAIIGECRETLQQVQREIRALSFLAHPPSLATNTLQAALRQLVSGFAARTGIEVEQDIASVGDASASVQAAIYRVSQEALANMHRHARASRAIVRLIARGNYLHLVISDNGVGISIDAKRSGGLGVGLMGMEERVRELGGHLSFHYSDGGTSLTASFSRMKRMLLLSGGLRV